MIKKMKTIRKLKNESQRDLAEAIGYHQTQIARYEKGRLTPQISYLVAFCEHYKVSADYILGLPKDLEWPIIREEDDWLKHTILIEKTAAALKATDQDHPQKTSYQ